MTTISIEAIEAAAQTLIALVTEGAAIQPAARPTTWLAIQAQESHDRQDRSLDNNEYVVARRARYQATKARQAANGSLGKRGNKALAAEMRAAGIEPTGAAWEAAKAAVLAGE